MNTTDNKQQQLNRCVVRAVRAIQDAMGWLDDAARLVPGPDAAEFYQATYDLDKARARVEAVEARVRS